MLSIDKLYEISKIQSEYFKTKTYIDNEKLVVSTTLYIGNLSFYTSESKIYNHFSQCGIVKKVIMGLNKVTKFPCGFCFVEFYVREDAQKAVNLLNNSKLDTRSIRVDWDIGFEEGRQYGRGHKGGQKRDEFAKKDDPDRPRGSYTNDNENKERYGERNNYRGNYGNNKYNNQSNDYKYNNDNRKYDNRNNRDNYLGRKREDR